MKERRAPVTISLNHSELRLLDSLTRGVHESRSACLRVLIAEEAHRRKMRARRQRAADEQRTCDND